jgi:hypothetical protein
VSDERRAEDGIEAPAAFRSNAEIIGRSDVNDLEAIFSAVGVEEADGRHRIDDACPAEFTWDYSKGARPQLDRLYEKAKRAQWNGATDLAWDTEVDPEGLAASAYERGEVGLVSEPDLTGTALVSWGPAEWVQLGSEYQNWMLSQFLHGEQGALLCTAKIVETVPWIDAKYYAATQVIDEARHVEVFSRYLDTKL